MSASASSDDSLHRLLVSMMTQAYHCSQLSSAGSPTADYILTVSAECRRLLNKDFVVDLQLNNQNGELCSHYPPHIFLISESRTSGGKFLYPPTLQDLCRKACRARVRNRFPIPVLYYQGKLLCRSSTISAWPEAYSKSAMQAVSSLFNTSSADESNSEADPVEKRTFFDKTRGEDKVLLDAFDILHIVDLTVETKMFKYNLPVPLSSSEKVDKRGRYGDFRLMLMPYPGSEFFRVWSFENSLSMKGVYYNWEQPGVNVVVRLGDAVPTSAQGIDWNEYRSWDLTQMTTCYLRLILGLMVESETSVLIHCVSGWDRTPLFVALVRILMWADGLVHQTLSPIDMLYFTLAYDWYLFGHQLPERLSKDEFILHFCFHYLHAVKQKPELSVLTHYPHLETTKIGDLTRSEKLECLCSSFFSAYDRAERQMSTERPRSQSRITGLVNSIGNMVFSNRY